MTAVVFIALFGLVFIAGVLGAIFLRNGTGYDDIPFRTISVAVAVAGLVLGVIISLVSSFNSVQSRSVGIVTSFNKPVAVVGPGPHWLAPWEDVESFTLKQQTFHPRVAFKFNGGAAGSVDMTVSFNVDQKNAVELWQQWTTIDNVRNSVVLPRVENAVNQVMANYSPEDAVGHQAQIGKQVAAILQNSLAGDGVDVNRENIVVKNVNLSSNAQARVDSLVTANTNLQKASIAQKQAKIDAQTADIRKASATPQTVEQTCLDIVKDWDVKTQGPMPATFNCVGSSAGVVVSAK